MLATRIIPVVLYNGVQAVKTINFSNPRNVGQLMNVAKLYDARQVDELVFIDISSERHTRGPDFDTIRRFADVLFCTFTVGGGFTTVDHVQKAFDAGVDKILLGSCAEALLPALALSYGCQAFVVSSDDGRHSDPVMRARHVWDLGAGEILLQSLYRDGTMSGYDCDLIARVSSAVDCPVIACSGMGKPEHAIDAMKSGASAVAGASMFHFTHHTPLSVADVLIKAGFPVRKCTKN